MDPAVAHDAEASGARQHILICLATGRVTSSMLVRSRSGIWGAPAHRATLGVRAFLIPAERPRQFCPVPAQPSSKPSTTRCDCACTLDPTHGTAGVERAGERHLRACTVRGHLSRRKDDMASMNGTITRMVTDKGFGFVAAQD